MYIYSCNINEKFTDEETHTRIYIYIYIYKYNEVLKNKRVQVAQDPQGYKEPLQKIQGKKRPHGEL